MNASLLMFTNFHDANQMVIVIKGHCKMLRLLFQNWIDTAKEPGRAKKELMYT